MKYSVFVFDLDGTLLDTLEDLYLAVNYALRSCGYLERSREEVRAFIGNGLKKLLERAIGKSEKEAENFGEVFSAFKRYYGEHCTENTKPYDGVMEVLAAIGNAGKRCAIVSNKVDDAVKVLAKEYFGTSIGVAIGEKEEAGIRKKPAPDSVFAALQALGVETDGAVYIGDSEVDIQTAENAGLPCISVSWGMKTAEFLSRHGAQVILHQPKELLKYI